MCTLFCFASVHTYLFILNCHYDIIQVLLVRYAFQLCVAGQLFQHYCATFFSVRLFVWYT